MGDASASPPNILNPGDVFKFDVTALDGDCNVPISSCAYVFWPLNASISSSGAFMTWYSSPSGVAYMANGGVELLEHRAVPVSITTFKLTFMLH